MDKFLQDIMSTYWWISVVIVGLVINVLSSYVKSILENRLSKISSYWRNRTEQKAAEFAKNVLLLQSNTDLRAIYALREFRYRIRSVVFLIFALMFLIFAQSINQKLFGFVSLNFLSTLLMLLGASDHLDAIKVKDLVKASLKELDEIHP